MPFNVPGVSGRPQSRPLSLLRGAGRFTVTLLASGPVLGALMGFILFALCLRHVGDFAVMGVRDEALKAEVTSRFGQVVINYQIWILAWYLGLGCAAGSLLALLWRSLGWLVGFTPTGWHKALFVVLALLTAHTAFTGLAMALYPQLFAEAFWNQQGAWAWVQLTVTDTLGPYPFLALLALLALALLAIPLGLARRLVPHAMPGRRTMILCATGGLLAGTMAALGLHGPSSTASPQNSGPNLLIIGIDSLRPDRLAPQRRGLAPALDSLADRGVAFTNAYVSLPRTFPSWTTILTGLYPHRHRVRTMFPPLSVRRAVPLALPARLERAGYTTALLSDYAGDIFSRINYGFSQVEAPSFNFYTLIAERSLEIHTHILPYLAATPLRRYHPTMEAMAQNADPERLTDRALEALEGLADKPKFAMTLFYTGPHFPYAAPYPYYHQASQGYEGAYRYHKPSLPNQEERLTDGEIAHVRALYDGAVSATDQAVGRLLEGLDRLGLAGRTQILLLADHGENLYEHGRGMGHGDHLMGDQANRIPLIYYDPRRPGPRQVGAVVRDVDVLPTLLAGLGLPPAPEGDGVDLSPLIDGRATDLDLAAFGETGLWFVESGPGIGPGERIPYPPVTTTLSVDDRGEVVLKDDYRDLVMVAKHRMIRTRTHKLIYRPTRAGVRWSLYDLATDPEQLHDRAGDMPEVTRALRFRLLDWLRKDDNAVLREDFVLPVVANR